MLNIVKKGDQRFLCNEAGENVVRLRAFREMEGSTNYNVFILASGPSVAGFPIEKYRDSSFVAMNGSILACSEHEIQPCFYICDDESFARDRTELAILGLRRARHVGMSFAVLSRVYAADPHCLEGVSVFLLERANRFLDERHLSHRAYAWSIRRDHELHSMFSLFSKNKNRIGFSMNLDKGYFVARTIPYVALQLCWQLGFKKVFMVGVDMSQEQGRFYEKGSAAAPSSLDDSFSKTILPSFIFMRRKVVRKDIFEVYNLSKGSRIPDSVIKKIGLEELDQLLLD